MLNIGMMGIAKAGTVKKRGEQRQLEKHEALLRNNKGYELIK